MTNPIHLIVMPEKKSNLGRAIGEVHRRYTPMINFRENWKGYLWQGRFASYPMDESWLLKAAAYVELNPVKAGMVKKARNYRWSSVNAHLTGKDPNRMIQSDKLLSLTGDWKAYLKGAQGHPGNEFEHHERTGRPLGDDRVIEKAERLLHRELKKKKPGPKGGRRNNQVLCPQNSPQNSPEFYPEFFSNAGLSGSEMLRHCEEYTGVLGGVLAFNG